MENTREIKITNHLLKGKYKTRHIIAVKTAMYFIANKNLMLFFISVALIVFQIGIIMAFIIQSISPAIIAITIPVAIVSDCIILWVIHLKTTKLEKEMDKLVNLIDKETEV